MIQFNLLPDVKLQYIKARRMKQLVLVISVAVSGVSLVVLLLSFLTVNVVQKKSIRDLDTDVASSTKELKAIPNLDKILTVQNQLNTLTGLHDQKAAASRAFSYISQVTPNGVTISSSNFDFTANTVTINGAAPTLDTVNKFVDTLKNTVYAAYTTDKDGQLLQASDDAYFKEHNSYAADSEAGKKKAFNSVVLASFGKDDKQATYGVTFSFDPVIFSNTNNVVLHIPTGTVTNTSVLFKAEN